MKLAKKTLSVALAAIMAASSLVGATSAFAAVNYVPSSEPVVKAVSVGTTTVTPDVKIDTKYAAKTADLTDAAKKETNINNQIDQTTLNNYYSFTPAKTGAYTIKITSTAVFEGYDKQAYDKAYAANANLKEADKVERATDAAHKYAASYEGLYTDTTFATKLTAADALDSAVIANMAGKDAFVATTTVTSKDTASATCTLSYKYDATKKDVVADKQVKDTTVGKDVTVSVPLLTAGKTYFFQVTVKNFLTTKEEITDKVSYTNVVKSAAAPAAQVTIAMEADEVVKTNVTSDTQKVEVPFDFAGATYDSKTGKYYVNKTVDVLTKEVTNNGTAAACTVKDEIDGVKVTKFNNTSAALTTLTLGKNIEAVTGCNTKNLTNVTITNPDFVVTAGMFNADAKITAPANSVAAYTAAKAGYLVNAACAKHDLKVVKAATVFAAGQSKCAICDAVVATAKVKFAPTFKAKKGAVEVKGNAGKVAKIAVWVDGKKTVKKNVTKCTVKKLKAGKHVVKVKLYDANGNKTATVKKTVKVK